MDELYKQAHSSNLVIFESNLNGICIVVMISKLLFNLVLVDDWIEL